MTTELEKAIVHNMVPASQADQFLSTIQQAAANPDVDINKMKELYALYKDVKTEESRVEYNRAMSEAQAEMPAIEKIHLNTQTDSYYAKIEDVIRAIKPVWTSHGFSLSFYPGEDSPEGFVRVKCDVSHSGGDTRTFSYDSPIDDKGIQGKVNKTQTHGRASGFTYGERYLIGMIFSLEVAFLGQDNDGNSVVERITDDQAKQITAMITDNGLSLDRFKKYLRSALKCDSIDDIAAHSFDRVVQTINNEIKKSQK